MNRHTFGGYSFALSIWVLVPAGAGFVLFEYLVPQYAFASYPLVPATTIALGLSFYPVLKKARTANEQGKSRLYLAGIGVKMLFSVAVVLAAMLNDKANALMFAATYFVFYVVLTIFENRCFNAQQ
jgi:ABC-type Fe3+-siderophore transport system permease subunit